MRLPYLLTAGHHLGIDCLTPLEKGREIPPAGLELGPEVVHIAAVRIAQCVGQVLIGHQGPAVAPVQAAQQDHRPTAVGPGIGEFEPQAHRQEDLKGFGLSRCRRAGIFALGHRVLLWRLSGLREIPEYTTKKRGGDDLFWRCFVKNDIEGIQPPFGRFWGARRTLSLYMSSFDDATASKALILDILTKPHGEVLPCWTGVFSRALSTERGTSGTAGSGRAADAGRHRLLPW